MVAVPDEANRRQEARIARQHAREELREQVRNDRALRRAIREFIKGKQPALSAGEQWPTMSPAPPAPEVLRLGIAPPQSPAPQALHASELVVDDLPPLPDVGASAVAPASTRAPPAAVLAVPPPVLNVENE